MTDDPSPFYVPRRQVILAVLVFAVLALLLNAVTFVNWAREAPLPADFTEWLIRQADRIYLFAENAGFNTLYDTLQGAVERLREPE